jgi:NAD(P)-dependent dehydrogenase (short-subunit alcohol dehydrogenase family)
MTPSAYRSALIIGAGEGISASLARALSANGVKVALAARGRDKLSAWATEIGALTFAADATDPIAVALLFAQVNAGLGGPDVVVYNAAARAHGPVGEIEPDDVLQSIKTTAFGGFLAVHEAAKRMVPAGSGAILLTGASASLKGYPQSSAFAMGKFALRGLAQSAARELGPLGIHVAHFVIDGGVRRDGGRTASGSQDEMLDPAAIADAYMAVLRQPRSAWSQEIDLRPWRERF